MSRSFAVDALSAVGVFICISIFHACLRRSLFDAHALSARVKRDKGRQIVANEDAVSARDGRSAAARHRSASTCSIHCLETGLRSALSEYAKPQETR